MDEELPNGPPSTPPRTATPPLYLGGQTARNAPGKYTIVYIMSEIIATPHRFPPASPTDRLARHRRKPPVILSQVLSPCPR